MDPSAYEQDGHGEASQMDLEELRKALAIGTTDPPTGKDSLRVESLESTLKVTTYLNRGTSSSGT
jgi:hypothetical protein